MLPRFLQEVCASGHYVSHRTDNGVLICDASCERSNPGPPLPPPGGLGLDFVSQTFSPRLWRCSGSLTLLGRGSCEASHSSIHPSAWRDCMKSPQRRVNRLTMRRLIAAYTNASPLAQSFS